MERESGMGNRESIVRKAGGRAPCLPAFTHTGEDATNDSLCSKGFSAELDRYFSQQDDFLFTDLKISPFPNDEPLSTFQTRRAADRMSVVFRFAMDGESKNPDSDTATGLICRGKVLSFAYFSLHEQRKVGRARARKPLTLANQLDGINRSSDTVDIKDRQPQPNGSGVCIGSMRPSPRITFLNSARLTDT